MAPEIYEEKELATITITRSLTDGNDMWLTDYGDFADFDAAVKTIEQCEKIKVDKVIVEICR